ncbi:MAG: hypothetical protein WC055_04385 [Melioribacteraceae bacterium]
MEIIKKYVYTSKTLRIPPELHEKIKEISEFEGRSIYKIVLRFLMREVREYNGKRNGENEQF